MPPLCNEMPLLEGIAPLAIGGLRERVRRSLTVRQSMPDRREPAGFSRIKFTAGVAFGYQGIADFHIPETLFAIGWNSPFRLSRQVPEDVAHACEGNSDMISCGDRGKERGRAALGPASVHGLFIASRLSCHAHDQRFLFLYWIRLSRQSRMLARLDMAGGLTATRRECTPPVALLAVTNRSGEFVLGL